MVEEGEIIFLVEDGMIDFVVIGKFFLMIIRLGNICGMIKRV